MTEARIEWQPREGGCQEEEEEQQGYIKQDGRLEEHDQRRAVAKQSRDEKWQNNPGDSQVKQMLPLHDQIIRQPGKGSSVKMVNQGFTDDIGNDPHDKREDRRRRGVRVNRNDVAANGWVWRFRAQTKRGGDMSLNQVRRFVNAEVSAGTGSSVRCGAVPRLRTAPQLITPPAHAGC